MGVKMDFLKHGLEVEVKLIDLLQKSTSADVEKWIAVTKVADPAFCLSTIWPVIYCLSPRKGSMLLWLLAFSEWLNVMSKWILNGHRPYWWAPINLNMNLDQYPVTCETGPGNPSGHCWLISATVTFLIVEL